MAILTGQIVIDADKGIVVLVAIAALYLCRTGVICRRAVVALHEAGLTVIRRRAGSGRRVVAVVIAFIGVMMVARPGSGVLGWWALLPLITAFLLAIYMVMTRLIRTRDDPAATTFYSTAVGAVVLSVAVAFHWETLNAFQWLLMVTMGGAGAMGHYLLVKAFHTAEASMLAPFTYSQVIGAIIWGFIVFGDVPSTWSTAGATLIIGSGIYVWYREAQLHRAHKAQKAQKAKTQDA